MTHTARIESYAFAAVSRVRCICGYKSEYLYSTTDADRMLGEHMRWPEAVYL